MVRNADGSSLRPGCHILSEEDRARIAGAIGQAEAATAGEIVVVIETDPCEETDATIALVAAGFIAIFSAGPLFYTSLAPHWIVVIQAAVFAGLAALAASSRVRRALRIDRLPSRAAHDAALRTFEELKLERTRERTAVLIHVAVADRHVEVIADEGVHEAVAPESWRDAVRDIVSAAGQDRLVDGIVAAVGRCGAALADVLPPEPGLGDELPNEPVIR
ncbi:TPM domain-containing protein [Methylopila sp. M107]|uniref:TPM domain-containing protein n=1 Tax=Methylopila sp. M107 TaxID=1101190 RepID=UPI000373EB1F|nr:TPM domain-containing protein [Methylopila sp. M107]